MNKSHWSDKILWCKNDVASRTHVAKCWCGFLKKYFNFFPREIEKQNNNTTTYRRK